MRYPQVLSPDNFPYTLPNSLGLLTEVSDRDLELVNHLYYQGDTWQFWIGPLPPAKDQNASEVYRELRKVFQRSNKIRECIDRHASSLVGEPFHYYFVDDRGERSEAEEAEILIQNWLNHVAESCLTAEHNDDPWWKCVRDMAVYGRGYLRLWMPKKYANSSDRVTRVHLHSPDISTVTVDRDDEGFIEKITYRYGKNRKEVQTMNPDGSLAIAQYDGETVTEEYRLDLGGHWTIYELRSLSMISEDCRDAQNNINLAKTMQSRTLIQNGFVERVIMNAQLPGRWIEDASSPTGQRFEPNPEGLQVGAGRTAFVQGTPVYDELGQVRNYASPSISYKDPAPVDTFQTAIAGDIEQIYHSMGQGHLLANENQISGISRVQLRQDAEIKTQRHEKVIKAAFGGIIGAFLASVEQNNLIPVIELRKSVHWISPEEQTQIIAAFNAGLMSKSTAIARLGFVDDPDAELALLEEEQEEAMKRIPQPKLPTEENPPNQEDPEDEQQQED